MHFCREVAKSDQLIEIIEDRTEFMKNALKRRKRFIMTQFTIEKAERTIIDEELYYDPLRFEPFHINSFKSIGWPDPWPHPMMQAEKESTLAIKRNRIVDDVSSDEDDFLLDKLGNKILGTMEHSLGSLMYPQKSPVSLGGLTTEKMSTMVSPKQLQVLKEGGFLLVSCGHRH